jgi:hypothetical protein
MVRREADGGALTAYAKRQRAARAA